LNVSQDYVTARSAEANLVRLIELPGADHFDVIDPRSRAWRAVLAEIKNAADGSSQRKSNCVTG